MSDAKLNLEGGLQRIQNHQACPKKIKKVDHVRILKKEIGMICSYVCMKTKKNKKTFFILPTKKLKLVICRCEIFGSKGRQLDIRKIRTLFLEK